MRPEKIIAARDCNIAAHEPRFSELIKLRSIVARDLADSKNEFRKQVQEQMIEEYNNELKAILGL